MRLLEGFHGYVGPLEARLADDLGDAAFLAPRLKAGLLADDLCHFGHDARSLAALPRCRTLPPTAGKAGWGVLYVLEGATLGGTLIARRLRTGLGVGPDGARYMTSYGAAVGPMWSAFRLRLAAEFGDPAGDDTVVAAARETFRTLSDWLRLALERSPALTPDADTSGAETPHPDAHPDGPLATGGPACRTTTAPI